MISELRNKIIDLSNEITSAISEATNINDVEDIRINSLGKKGTITLYLKNLREYDEASKKEIGALINDTKNKINQLIIDKKSFFKTKALN
jgi:phenylalanyl-tRNA synthetase alpha chain